MRAYKFNKQWSCSRFSIKNSLHKSFCISKMTQKDSNICTKFSRWHHLTKYPGYYATSPRNWPSHFHFSMKMKSLNVLNYKSKKKKGEYKTQLKWLSQLRKYGPNPRKICTNEIIQVQRIAVSSVWVTDTIRWSPNHPHISCSLFVHRIAINRRWSLIDKNTLLFTGRSTKVH